MQGMNYTVNFSNNNQDSMHKLSSHSRNSERGFVPESNLNESFLNQLRKENHTD